MTTIKVILLVVFFITSLLSFGQTSSFDDSSLSGTWYLVNAFPSTKDSLVYERTSKTPHNWGDRIEFNASNSFVDAYSAKCGNDSQIHKDLGTWNLFGTTILTTIPIGIDKGTRHKILRLTAEQLVLKKIE